MDLTIEDLRQIIAELPGNLPVRIAYQNAYGNDAIIAKVEKATTGYSGLILHEAI